MGYTTDFNGIFYLDCVLEEKHKRYLEQFASIRHMARDVEKLKDQEDYFRENVGLPLGVDGEYFTGGTGSNGQDRTEDILNYNSPPSTQPGLWCQWTPTDDGYGIEWDEGEKFYHYIKWLKYIIENFLKPWNYVLNGIVKWSGEDDDDLEKIIVENNVVTTKIGEVVYR